MVKYATAKLNESNVGKPGYNKDRVPYDLLDNNCGTFAADVVNQDTSIEAPDVILNPTPPNIVSEYQDEGHKTVTYAPSETKPKAQEKPNKKKPKPQGTGTTKKTKP